MKLVNSNWTFSVDFYEGVIEQLVIESPTTMCEVLSEIKKQCAGEEGQFVLSDCGKELSVSQKVDLIVDPFSIDINNKKVIKQLYDELSHVAYEEDNYLNTQGALSGILNMIEDITEDSRYSLSYSMDVNLQTLFKDYEVKIDVESSSFEEYIIEYTNAMKDYCDIKLFILVNLKNYVEKEKMIDLYSTWIYNKINVLLIESSQNEILDHEETWIIDKDMCEIHI